MVSVRRSNVALAQEGRLTLRYPWQATGSVDVEVLARWAYGAQMVDRFERSGLNAMERAISGFEPSGYSACGVGQLMQIAHLGARIDRGGAIVSDAVHPAALALALALGQVENGKRVRFHALAGTRPALWDYATGQWEPVAWVKPGKVAEVEYEGPGRKGGYCRVVQVWDHARKDFGRADYGLWWQALADLAWALSSRALGFVVTGPAAAARPWESDERAEASPIALDDGPEAERAPPSGSSRATRA